MLGACATDICIEMLEKGNAAFRALLRKRLEMCVLKQRLTAINFTF